MSLNLDGTRHEVGRRAISWGAAADRLCRYLFYINPSFAILDECTSAVSVDVEEELYRHAHNQGITDHDLATARSREFHSQELKLGDAEGEKGWALRNISSDA